MASLERLTKRVKKMEEWIAENDETGGPAGLLETFNYLINEVKRLAQEGQQHQNAYGQMRQMTFKFLELKKLESEWDEYVKAQEAAKAPQASLENIEAPNEKEENKKE